MAEELKIACARPTGAPVGEEKTEPNQLETIFEEEERTMIAVGKKAPEFSAPAFYKGDFVNVKLSDYLGKWVLLCFYPGDFTFV